MREKKESREQLEIVCGGDQRGEATLCRKNNLKANDTIACWHTHTCKLAEKSLKPITVAGLRKRPQDLGSFAHVHHQQTKNSLAQYNSERSGTERAETKPTNHQSYTNHLCRLGCRRLDLPLSLSRGRLAPSAALGLSLDDLAPVWLLLVVGDVGDHRRRHRLQGGGLVDCNKTAHKQAEHTQNTHKKLGLTLNRSVNNIIKYKNKRKR